MSTPIISVTGLGYVGLPVAVSLAQHFRVIAYDNSATRLTRLQHGIDDTGEVSPQVLQHTALEFTNDPMARHAACFHIVTVPTPIDASKRPDLSALKMASHTLGPCLNAGDIVVFESTVYPGVTEHCCGPLLEASSGLTVGKDLFLGYSPERINPGDTVHRFNQISKVIAATDLATREQIAAVYGRVIEAELYLAESIQVAEAAKVIENTQRDLNVALMNELAIIFNRMGIDTQAVLRAAGSKWNFMPFTPGLVGGHCIGVDPYYLTHIAEQYGYHPQVILAGRNINDDMGIYIGEQTIKRLIHAGKVVKGAHVLICGLTFKENCADIRNTRVIDVVRTLQEYGVKVSVHDPIADKANVRTTYGITLLDWDQIAVADALVLCVRHHDYCQMQLSDFKVNGPIIDVKGIFDPDTAQRLQLDYWRL